MKVSMHGSCLLAFGLALASAMPALATDIYKTVDADGHTVYTDRPPSPDAKPISLRELSVVEAPSYARPAPRAQDDDSNADSAAALRQRYGDFKLVSPAPDQNFWGTGNTATIAWDTDERLASGLGVIFFVDGQAVTERMTAATYTTAPLDRGTHQARADLVDANDNVIATAGPVPFHIMQQSQGGR